MTSISQLALDDMRARRQAVIELLRSQDQQAVALLGTYSMLSVACISGAAAAMAAASMSAKLFAASLIGPGIAFMLGGLCCYRILATSKITLPGRESAFWQWTIDHGIGEDGIIKAYTAGMIATDHDNDEINRELSDWLGRARACGIAAAPAAAISTVMFSLLYALLAT